MSAETPKLLSVMEHDNKMQLYRKMLIALPQSIIKSNAQSFEAACLLEEAQTGRQEKKRQKL